MHAIQGKEAEKLHTLARAIRSRVEVLEESAQRIQNDGTSWLSEAMLLGDELAAAKYMTNQNWEAWLQSQCPILTPRKANRFIALSVTLREKELRSHDPLQLYLKTLDDESKGEHHVPRQSPAPVLAIKKFSEFSKVVGKFDLDSWQPAQMDRLKELMEPIARRLWPDLFSSPHCT